MTRSRINLTVDEDLVRPLKNALLESNTELTREQYNEYMFNLAEYGRTMLELNNLDVQVEVPKLSYDLCKQYKGYPEYDSPNGLYMNGADNTENIQYAIFSSKGVAKKSLEVLETDDPIIFGVFSRIKKEGVAELLDFFEAFIELLTKLNVSTTNLELGSLDLSRLGRSYSSFSALFTMFEMASDNGIGIKFMGSSEPVALFGICTGAISQTNMRFNQTMKRLKSRYRKANSEENQKLEDDDEDKIIFSQDQYAKGSVSDLVNNKTAYQPHLSTMEYYAKITSELGTDEWKVHL